MTEATRLTLALTGKTVRLPEGPPESRIYLGKILCWFWQAFKKQEARSFLTGLLIGGIELKDRSVGGWRSGLQRSEK
ncbi:MAG: hypothetical protein WAQ99_11220 [Pyrinomonadaceae bacterium]